MAALPPFLNRDMQPKKSLILAALFTLSATVIAIMYFLTASYNRSPNAFIRLFRPDLINQRTGIDIKYNSYYIAGVIGRNIYLGNFVARADLLITDDSLTNIKNTQLKLPDNGKFLSNNFKLRVDSNGIYLTDGLRPMILLSTPEKLSATRYTYDSINFIECVPVSPRSFILRSVDTQSHENRIIKEVASTPHEKISADLLQKQIDGFFCTDGILNYDPSRLILVYTYFYRNQFICFDTSLNLIYRGKTIDTTSYAKLKIATSASGMISKLAGPPFTVNKRAVVNEGLLYIYSALRANNETTKSFNSYSVIDIYSLDTGAYKFSIYVNNIHGKKINSFYVHNHKLMTIHDHYLLIHDLAF